MIFYVKNSCSYSISNNINYFDGGHLTKSGSLFLKNYFNDFVKIMIFLDNLFKFSIFLTFI